MTEALPPQKDPVPIKEPIPLINRDLSWIQFNIRVLEEAEEKRNPLFERVKFLAISASNLDEFHMVRVSAKERAIVNLLRRHEEKGKKELEQLQTVRAEMYSQIGKFIARQRKVFEGLSKELSEQGIHIVAENSPVMKGELGRKIFEKHVLSAIPAPDSFSVDKLSELSNFEVAILCPGNLWVKVPKDIPLVLMQEGTEAEPGFHFFFLDRLLRAHLWPEKRGDKALGFVRLTRGADESINLTNSDPDFIPDVVLTSIKTRDRGVPVRLQLEGNIPDDFSEQARKILKLSAEQVVVQPSSMFLHGLWALIHKTPEAVIKEKKLSLPSLTSKVPKAFRDRKAIFLGVKKKDYLLHHPYDSFNAYVALIEAACNDDQVTKIEQTVYRIDAVSQVTKLLKEAASKKDIRVMIELRARFDEMNNLRLAEEMRQAGVKVKFGFGNLKLHAKVALITRKEEGGVSLYTHLSTGNYNAATARQYTDMALITANPEIGADVRQFFDSLYSGQEPHSFKRLVIAPQFLARRMLAHIKEETESARAGKPARIFAKVNALVDDKIIEALYEASKAGVKIDLVVRGACSLVPGLAGVSENIKVISIVDRFLEHSRIYYFENAQKMYLSSADWMPRNFFSRLEIAFPVLDARVFEFLKTVVIPAYLGDASRGRNLNSQGLWKQQVSKATETLKDRAQVFFASLAENDYRGTPLE